MRKIVYLAPPPLSNPAQSPPTRGATPRSAPLCYSPGRHRVSLKRSAIKKAPQQRGSMLGQSNHLLRLPDVKKPHRLVSSGVWRFRTLTSHPFAGYLMGIKQLRYHLLQGWHQLYPSKSTQQSRLLYHLLQASSTQLNYCYQQLQNKQTHR